MDAADLFSKHVSRLQSETEKWLDEAGFDSLVVSSGSPFTFFADDRDAPFEPTPHFAHWCPLERAPPPAPRGPRATTTGRSPRPRGLLVRAGWGDRGVLGPGVRPRGGGDPRRGVGGDRQPDARRLRRRRGRAGGSRGVRGEPEGARGPPGLDPQLQGRLGDRRDRAGHGPRGPRARAAREAFATGASEMEIHHAYLAAVGTTEGALPYTTIIALDAHGATLHYETKRTARNGRVLLCDAGAQVHRYACDITRTATAPSCDPRFAEMVGAMDALEQDLVRASTPGRPYLEVHVEAHRGVGRILSDTESSRSEPRRPSTGADPPLPAPRDRSPPRHPGPRRGREAVRPGRDPGPAPEGVSVPAQHPDHRARSRVHDRAGHLLHPDAAPALPRRGGDATPSTGRRSTPSPRSAGSESRTTWS